MNVSHRLASAIFFLTLACGALTATVSVDAPSVRHFGKLPDGREAHLYTLRAADGFQADICDYGSRVVRLLAPDRAGRLADVVIGFDDVGAYAHDAPYYGATVGRVANRIAGAKFVIDGRTYTLTANETTAGMPGHLHGGVTNFSQVLWSAEPTTRDGQPALRLRYTSPDGEEGYPGTLHAEVLYLLTADHGLRIDYTTATDKPTPFNPTNHTFFNLAGEGSGTILSHVATIHARSYTPVTLALVPTGEIAPVAGTPLDFTTPSEIGARIADSLDQLRLRNGYDHYYVLDSNDGALALAATVAESASGRVLEMLTTEPGVQFFTANGFTGKFTGKSGRLYPRFGGFCLETQHAVDAVNQPQFADTILRPGQIFRSTTIFRFSIR